MELKELVKALNKRIVLIPLGILASIASIVGVIHQLLLENHEFENLISEYVNTSNHLNRYQVEDSMSSDGVIIKMERIQDDIELYIRSIAKISSNSDENGNRIAIAKQNLLVISDGYDIACQCRSDLFDLALTADSLVLSNIEKYIPLNKLDESNDRSSAFNQYLNKKRIEIEEYADSGNQDKMMKTLEQIFSSEELAEYLAKNKSLYIDIYDSLNLMKRKYQQQSGYS